jgi:AcrR family transcriptional regulator
VSQLNSVPTITGKRTCGCHSGGSILYPSREALLEALLRKSFDALTARAGELEASRSAGDALVSWLRETVAVTHSHRGVIASAILVGRKRLFS